MSTINKQQISDALKEAMNHEDLHTRAVAQKLNLNPCYISMCQNPNSWDSMGKTAWLRLEEWANTRGQISEFVIPDGEEIWKAKEKVASSQAPRNDGKKPEFFTKTSVKKAEALLKSEIKEHLKSESDHSKGEPFSKEYVNDLLAERAKMKALIDYQEDLIKNQGAEIEELVCMTKTAPDSDMTISDVIRQKLAVDIEINLVLNGQRVQIG
jgi:hypothetical protein